MDFFHFQGKTALIVIDSFSKYVEVKIMKKTSAGAVIGELKEIFSVGKLVADNGPHSIPWSTENFSGIFKSNIFFLRRITLSRTV